MRGKIHYFGKWDDPDAALDNYLKQKDDLHVGRTPRPDPGAVTVKDVANDFLSTKQALVDAGELSARTWADSKEVCDLVVSQFGRGRLVEDLRPDDFAALRNKVAKRWGPLRLGTKLIQYTRSLFKHAFDAGLIDRPVRFGPGFKRPSQKTIRLQRAGQGPRLFTAEEIRTALVRATTPMRAMILLAIREALAKRPEPKQAEHAGLVFITKYGLPWAKDEASGPVTQEMRKLLKKLGINGHRNFYTLRHTFRTIADEAKDQPAADYIMGHEVAHMSSVYRETISDERLRSVTDHVRDWLFDAAPARGTA
jgi:hypothetical protein